MLIFNLRITPEEYEVHSKSVEQISEENWIGELFTERDSILDDYCCVVNI